MINIIFRNENKQILQKSQINLMIHRKKTLEKEMGAQSG